ncbi:MAG TPA: hypothetical protein ENN19_07900 [Chloroflexi bacterium]|nr:hypothetical protein [Chloroflexota bacterium]
MELSWINKVRIGAVIALGVVVIGVLAWPLAAPNDPMSPVRSSDVSFVGTLGLLVLAFAVGVASFFVAWPHGREIGILAVPFGLATWAIRSGPMQSLTQTHATAQARQEIVRSLSFEPVYWLLIVAAGFIGVLVAQCICSKQSSKARIASLQSCLKPNAVVIGLFALLIAVLVCGFFIGAFAQDLPTSGKSAAAQPHRGQIVFAGIGAFAVAGFLVKKLFDLSYAWTALAGALVIPFATMAYYRSDMIEKFAETQPATFFPHAIFAVLPVQLVAFGAIGSVIGYWMAIQYEHWRQHESAA